MISDHVLHTSFLLEAAVIFTARAERVNILTYTLLPDILDEYSGAASIVRKLGHAAIVLHMCDDHTALEL